MDRFSIRFLIAICILAVSAVLEVGPRASAAFALSVGSVESHQVSESGANSDSPFSIYLIDPDNGPIPQPCLHNGGSGGMSSPDSSSASGSSPVFGDVTRVNSERTDLVVYCRERAALLYDSAFVDSLLDPPRSVFHTDCL
jgi:hypothetical protein